MKHIWILIIFLVLTLVACGGAEEPTVTSETAVSNETNTEEGAEVNAFTLENLRFYGSREYYLRRGENILAIAEWIT
ncbi:MAG: hypothetical protein H6773_00940 [Pseudomonadales bacterium]|nr:hypothetical protein [Candidatus Woesebacteria bacterium]MCB9800723.1 hypothetical protein [Pseudomonadales bacterium]